MKLEVGKYYRTRDGRKVGPAENQGWADGYIWRLGIFEYYNQDGQMQAGCEKDDIIAEWTEPPTTTPNKYARTIRSETVDVYDVLHAFKVTDAATAHAVKKLLMAGQRGHKDKITDLREAIDALERQVQIEGEK